MNNTVPETITFWECDNCGFRMWDKHTWEDGTITCPLCEIDELRAENKRLAAQLVRLIAKEGVRDEYVSHLLGRQSLSL